MAAEPDSLVVVKLGLLNEAKLNALQRSFTFFRHVRLDRHPRGEL